MKSNPDFSWMLPLTDRSSKGSSEVAFEYNSKLKKRVHKNMRNKEAYYSKATKGKCRNRSKKIKDALSLDK